MLNYKEMKMEFRQCDWEVDTTAHNLSASLFNQIPGYKSAKKQKRLHVGLKSSADQERVVDKKKRKHNTVKDEHQVKKKKKEIYNQTNTTDTSCDKLKVGKDESLPITQLLETKNTGSQVNGGTDRKKKKRKRKCKKNKFKDYSETEDMSASPFPTTCVRDPHSNVTKPSVHLETCKKKLSSSDSVVSKQTSAKVKASSCMKTDTARQQTLTKQMKKLENKSNSSKSPLSKEILTSMLKSRNAQMMMEEEKPVKKSSTLLEKSKERLNAARFRYLNEQLYTSTGDEAFQLFNSDTEAFQLYHDGFQSQVNKWPTNPVEEIIQEIKARPRHMVIADFGCGDAKLARSVPNKVHSFDLVAVNEHVTVCNMSEVPLSDSSVDMAVFCLSLMGTDLCSYLLEANRILKKGGVLKIAEVKSRFRLLAGFTKKVEQLGFKLVQQNADNKMFVMLDFKKRKTVSSDLTVDISLDPCLYKKR